MNKAFGSVLLHGADYNYEQWLDFPEILDADFDLMKRASCNVMSVGIFSWSVLEPEEGRYDFGWLDRLMDRLAENGIGAILATPSGSKPAWMSRNHPDSRRAGPDGRREPHGGRHNHCRTSASYRAACAKINTLLAERYKDHPALAMWHVSNEYNAGRCHCPDCLSAFRDWLKARYGTIDALNKAWWTTFWSHRYADWDEIEPVDPSVQGLMLDWARFTSDQTLDFFIAESEPLRRITPNVPITTNFMLPDVGLDYWKFAKYVDVVSWDSYPRWHAEGDDAVLGARIGFFHDLFRSLKGKPFLLMESTPSATNWQGVSKPKKPGMHMLSSLQAVAHGSDSVQYFQWRQSRGGEEKFHGAAVSHLGSGECRVFRDVTEVGKALKALSSAVGATVTSAVAIVYDFQNGWALDGAALPRSLEKRYQDTCVEHYAAFWRQNIACDLIDSSEGDFSRYRLVVLPMLYMFREGVAEKIRAYVAGGGTAVATYLTGLVDRSDLCFLGGTPGGLTDVFGVTVEFTDTVLEGERQGIRLDTPEFPAGETFPAIHYADCLVSRGAAARGVFTSGELAGRPALTENRYGAGAAWYVAGRTGADFLDRFYCALARRLSLPPTLANLPEGVSARERVSGGRRYLFLLNFREAEATVDLGESAWRDAVTGDAAPGVVALGPYGTRALVGGE